MNNYLKIIHNSIVEDKATDSNKKLVFNSLSWTRDGTVNDYIGGKKKEIKIKAIPPFSFKYIPARNLDANKKIEVNNELSYVEKNNSIILDNNTLRVVLNKSTGKIISVRLKEDQKEFIKSNKGIDLKVYKNKPPKEYAAWNIDLRYTQNKIPIKLENIEVIEESIRSN